MTEHDTRLKQLLAPDRLIWPLLLLAALLRIAALVQKGVEYDGNYVDAVRYMDSARILAATGRYTYASTHLSAYEMPGFSAFLSVFVLGAHGRYLQYFLIKTSFVLMSLLTIYLLYLLGRRIGGPRVGLISAAFLAFSIPNIYTGLLALSENPFSLAIVGLAVLIIRLGDSPSWKLFGVTIVVFVGTLYLRQSVLVMLPAAAIYLWSRGYPRRLLVQQMLTAVLVIVAALVPWWIRNYEVFHAFVPFQSFDGATLLEGTFQRFKPIDNGSFAYMDKLTRNFKGNELQTGQLFAAAAKQRFLERLKTNPVDLIITYAVTKPAAAWLLPHYWDEVLGASSWWIARIHAIVSTLGLVALGVLSVRSKARREFMFMGVCIVLITLGTIVYLGLHRYVYPFMPFLYVALAYSLDWLLRWRAGHSAAVFSEANQ